MNRLMNQTAYVERLLGKTRMSAHTWSLSRTCRFICQTLLIFLLGTTMAHATCTWQNGAGPLSYTYTIPQLTVPRDAAIGTVLYSAQTEATPATGVYMSCNSNDSWSYTVSGGTQVASSPSTYATNVPGIGMRFYRAQGATGSRQYYSPTNYGNYTGTWAFNSAYFGIEVVVTGPVGTGTIDGSLVGTFAQSTVAVITMRAATAGSITAATCQIVADQSLTMPYVGPKDLPTVGSSAGNTPFRITLTNCPAGMNQITYQLDAPAGVIAAANGTFLAGSGSSAKGVGFALRDSSNNPVGLGTPNTVTAYNAATGGTYPIQLAVQYYRTDTLGPGIVKGALTYTISYQ